MIERRKNDLDWDWMRSGTCSTGNYVNLSPTTSTIPQCGCGCGHKEGCPGDRPNGEAERP